MISNCCGAGVEWYSEITNKYVAICLDCNKVCEVRFIDPEDEGVFISSCEGVTAS